MKTHRIPSLFFGGLLVLCLTGITTACAQSTNWPQRVLITNDDGIDSPGIQALAQAFAQMADTYVVAPLQDQSGTGHNMVYPDTGELVVESRNLGDGIQAYAVDGLPADCVVLALTGIMRDNPPDLVVSGINTGANLGAAWIGSGTIGAARIAALGGIPAIAASGTMVDSVDAAAYWVAELARSPIVRELQPPQFLTVSFPRVSASLVKGIRITERTGLEDIPIFEKVLNEGGNDEREIWRITGEQEFQGRTKSDNDKVLYNKNYVVVVPMRADEHDYTLLADLPGRLNSLPEWPQDLASESAVQLEEHTIPHQESRTLQEVALFLQSNGYEQVVEIEFVQNTWKVKVFDGERITAYTFEPRTLDLLNTEPLTENPSVPPAGSKSVTEILEQVEAEGYIGVVRMVDFILYKDQPLWGVGLVTDTAYRQIGLDPLSGEVLGEK